MVRVAMIGIGGYGRALLRTSHKAEEQGLCRVAAAADARLGELESEARELTDKGVAVFADAEELLDRAGGDCDAVYIATSIASHAPLACAALDRGLHVHLEKPPAATVQEVDAMLAAQQKAGRLCQVGFQFTCSRDMLSAKRAILNGEIGRLRTILCHAEWPRTQAYYDRNGWAGRLCSGDAWVLDGPATNALAHQIMNLLLLAGGDERSYAAPVWVRGEMYAAGSVESHNTAAIEIRTAEGVRLVFLATHASEGQFGPVIEIRGDAGRATWSMQGPGRVYPEDGAERALPRDEDQGREAMVRGFLRAVAENDAGLIRCTLDDARRFTVALDAAHESSGRIHRIADRHVRREGEGGDARTVVEGMDALLGRAAAAGCLLSDLPDAPPWTARTEAFETAGYERFPRQFRAE